ncbi:F-box domain - like 10 [Theobroma cacao]|nr:F-box domain - like 10 [Theobroma cacao]
MKRSKLVKADQLAANMMERLPQEVVLHILFRLPLTSLLQSKLVCQAWRSLIQDPLLISKHFMHMAKADNDPSFILKSNWPIPDQLHFIDFAAHSEGKLVSKKLPNSAMLMYLVDSCNGLLCMHNTSRSIYICNPFTQIFIELPEFIKYRAQVGHLGFGFHPTSKEYKVIQIVFRRQLRRGNSYVATPTLIQSEVVVNGRLRWLSKPNKYTMASLLVSFDLATEQFQEVPEPDCCGLDRCFHHLMVLRGCLSAVACHDNEQLDIWVMKKYGTKESWVKQFNIGTYLPRTLKQEDILAFNYSKRHFPKSFVLVLCILKSGEILLEYKSRALVVYDSQHGTFKELTFPEMPNWFQIIVHVGSLNWLDMPPANF